MFPGNLRGELYDSVEEFGVTLKKLKLGKDPHVDATQRKILKHQTYMDLMVSGMFGDERTKHFI